jgi:hypothetical protein
LNSAKNRSKKGKEGKEEQKNSFLLLFALLALLTFTSGLKAITRAALIASRQEFNMSCRNFQKQ